MRLFITGASGFIGDHLARHAKAEGHDVTMLRHREVGAIRGDTLVGDLAGLVALPKGRFDVIIHAAGLSWPGEASVADLARTNVQGTARLIDAAVKANIPRIVFLSTLSVLGKNISGSSWCNEQSMPVDPDAYGLSKLLCERMLAENSRLSSVSLRLPAVLGPGAARHFIARVAQQARDNADIHVHSASRMFNNVLWIDDLCHAVMDLLEKPVGSSQHDILNLAAHTPISMEEVLDTLQTCLDSKSRVIWGTALNAQPASRVNIDYAERVYDFNPLSTSETIARYAKELRQ